jgi:hypothetical protein
MLKEIDLIQDIIKRMASNSFLLKGWAISVITIILALKQTDSVALLAAVSILAFWYVDAYYLRQERLYRRLYKWVISNRMKSDDFLLDLDTKRFQNEVDSLICTMASETLIMVYGAILVTIAVIQREPLQEILASLLKGLSR